MRQGDGAELLGPGDPRSANIGVIHVAPTDDRQSVLTAIKTQEKLGRKQVVVVLPEHNRALRQSADFDGLKKMRRDMKADIVLIAPSGPGPADLARQRRFPVYSSLETYVASFQEMPQSAGSKRPQARRKSRFFGSKERSVATGTPAMIDDAAPETPQTPYPASMPPEERGGGRGHGGDAAMGAAAGFVAGAGLGALASRASARDAASVPAGNAPAYPHAGQPGAGDEDLETLPPAQPGVSNASNNAPGAITNTPPVAPAGPADQGMRPVDAAGPEDAVAMGAGPGIIHFPQSRGRPTGKLPVADMSTDQMASSAQAQAPVRQRTSGKMPVVGAAALGAGAGAAAMAGRGAVGAPPPVRRNFGGGPGPVGPGGQRRRPWWMLALIVLLLVTLLFCAVLAYARPSVLGPLGKALPIGVSTATVTITPKSVDLKNQYLITGVTGTPDATQRQVQARQFSANPSLPPQTVNATGHSQTPGANAHGTLTFQNSKFNIAQRVQAGTAFTANNGIQVVNDVTVDIPGAGNGFGQKTVPAHAIVGGAAGNIGAGAVSQVCCSTDDTIRVFNSSPFTGGQDPQNFTFVQQSDIDGVANPGKSELLQKAQQQFQAQIRPNEQLVSPAQCNSKVSSDHKAGDHATTVTVSVSASCTGEAYDHLGALAMAQTLLRTEAASNPGAGYALAGALLTSVTQATIIDPNKGTVALTVPAEGIWVYQIDDARKQQLAKLIAGKSKAEAARLLQQQVGIQKSDIQIDHGDGNTLPTDTANITIVIQNVPGLQGTPTPGGPGGTPTPTPITTVVPTPGGPGNQSPTPGLGGS